MSDEVRQRAVEAAIRAYDDEGSGYPVWEDGMRAAIAAYERALWQPIETAPRDGVVLVYAPSPDPARWHEVVQDLPPIVCTARWHPDAGWCVCTIREATHWRPLPAGPGDGA